MSTKISEELSKRLKEAGEASTTKELPVIITVEENSDLDALQEKGFKLQHRFEIINAVAGTVPAAAVGEIARLEQVQQIDYDGEVQALSPEDDDE